MKVIIWGYKYVEHTHRYIHSSFYKAFKSLGYETYWFDDKDDTTSFNFSNCLFLTEDQVQSNIPLIKSSKYILHHTKLDKYIENNLSFINIGNYSKSCQNGISPYDKDNSVEIVDDYCFWDKKSKSIFQPWATDLLPNEINTDHVVSYDETKSNIYYVGGWFGHENPNYIKEFSDTSMKDGRNFQIMKTNTDEENIKLIKDSFLSVDIRGDWHIEYGYLPCRIFKNISYGRLTGTNSPHVKEIFGDYVVYDSNISNLYFKLKEAEKNIDIKLVKNAMSYVKEKHTYETRIKNLIKII